jgi:predicted RNase H-like nuclease
MRGGVGVDGARGGWVAFALGPGGGWSLHPTAAELWGAHGHRSSLWVDMPVGLPGGPGGRRCDREARVLLGPRRSSVFSAPVRAVLEARDYAEALTLSRAASGVGLSRQSWGIVGKIRELDTLIRQEPEARRKVRESHPELVFRALNGGIPPASPKRTPEGFRERMVLLEASLPEAHARLAEGLALFPRKWVARDDLVDALALAWAANLAPTALQIIPETPEMDGEGIAMAISFPKERSLEARPAAPG